MASTFFIRARMFRRRHKTALLVSVVISAIVLLILRVHRVDAESIMDSSAAVTSDAINAIGAAAANKVEAVTTPDTSVFGSLFASVRSVFVASPKTVPFAQTGAAQQSEFNNIIKSTLQGQQHLQRISDETKLKLIVELHRKFDQDNTLLKQGHRFYERLFDILTKGGKPAIESLGRYKTKNRIYHARYQYKPESSEADQVFSEEYLSQFLQLDEHELAQMTSAHQYVVANLNNHKNDPPDGLYRGNGIVYVGGGKFNWLTLLSIKSIRLIGLELPIEVLIPKLDEYEADLCARVFPALNARCIYLPYVLAGAGSAINNIEFKGYQYKALAILLSSFENILLLDSDNIPVHPPDLLFKLEPFVLKGLIVWPDFWKRATLPDYYKIAGIKIDREVVTPKYNEKLGEYEGVPTDTETQDKSVPLHRLDGTIPDPTSESGQLMISKRTHMKALILALYYNMYGPSHFYPLFSQGSDGEGDKETFLAATVALGQPFYQVSRFLNAFGHFDAKNEFVGTGMGQYDPQEDYEFNKKRAALRGKAESEQQKLTQQSPLLKTGPRILFVHANFPKLNPWHLMEEGQIFNEHGHRIRLYGTGMMMRTGYDFETVQWLNMKFLLCELKIDLKAYEDVDREDLCGEIGEHLVFLKNTIHTLEKEAPRQLD